MSKYNLKSLDKEYIQNIMDTSNSWSDVWKKLTGNIQCRGSGPTIFKKYALSIGCIEDVLMSNKAVFLKHVLSLPRKSTPLEFVFIENSKVAQRTLRKMFLLHTSYHCNICGISRWEGDALTLQVDHINGINNDNRIENLRLLCPNCHSMTATWGCKKRNPILPHLCIGCSSEISLNAIRCHSCAAKYKNNSTKVHVRPSKEELINLIQESSYVSVGKLFGVSDNAIRKWVISYGLNPKTIKSPVVGI